MSVLVAGGGPVARALVAGLRRAGLDVATWSRAGGRGGAAEPVTVAVLAVSDGAIGEVARRLLDDGVIDARAAVLHCAGVLPPRLALAGVAHRVAGVGLLHPLRAVARGAVETDLTGTVFGVAGDETGTAAARELVARLAGVPLVLDEESLPRYHAAAALAGNHTLALVASAVELLVTEGLPRPDAERAASSLLRSAADNVAARGLPDALTGPIARGDVETVERHLAALPEAVLPLYRATACATLALARAQGRADPARLSALAVLLGCGNTNDSQSKR